MNYKINKTVLKELRGIAVELPKMMTTGEKIVSGQFLRDKLVFFYNGAPIKRDKWYSYEVPLEVNHLRLLKKAFITGGKDAVIKYGVDILKIATVITNGKENTNSEQGDTPSALPVEHAEPKTTDGEEIQLRKDDEQHGADLPGSEFINKAIERLGY